MPDIAKYSLSSGVPQRQGRRSAYEAGVGHHRGWLWSRRRILLSTRRLLIRSLKMNPSLSFSNFGSSLFEADEKRGCHCINVADKISGSAYSVVTNAISFSFVFGEAAASEAKTPDKHIPVSVITFPFNESDLLPAVSDCF